MLRKTTKAGPLAITGRAQLLAAAGDGSRPKRFSAVAYSGETIRQFWSDSPLVLDLDTLRLPSQSMPILYDHRSDAEWVAGRADGVRVENGQLLAEGPVYESTEGGQTVLKLAGEGHEWQVSIGADIGRLERVEAGATALVNGKEYPGPVEVARDVDLREISFVVIGAAKNTAAVVARRNIKGGAMDFETWVQSLGFDPSGLDETQAANMQRMFNEQYGEAEGETPAEEPAPEAAAAEDPPAMEEEEEVPPAAAARAAVLTLRRSASAEITRQSEIRQLCATAGEPTITANRRTVPLAAHAIEQGWTRERTELELLRQSREAAGPYVASRSKDKDCTLQALQGALLLRAGGRLDHPCYGSERAIFAGIPQWLRMGVNSDLRQRTMEAAHRYCDLSLVDLCRESLRLDGKEVPTNRGETIRAAFSGGSLTNIFTTNINAMLLATYMEAPDTTAGWVRESETGDFKTMDRIRLVKGGGLSKHPRGHEADHMSRSDTKESYKIARYSSQITVDEQDIIDDYYGALADLPVEMGYAAARMRPDLVYSILKANAALDADSVALFHSSHSNTDTSAALAVATLKTGITAIRLQRENSVNLNLQPSHLVVPTTLAWTAEELLESPTIIMSQAGTTDATTVRGSKNVLTGKGITLVVDSRLDNGVTDPSSGTAHSGDTNDWFLVAASAYGIEVCYLRGTGRSPQTRNFVLDKGKWGVGWDINLDIGAKALDYRGLYRGQG